MTPDKPRLTAILRLIAFGLAISIFAAALHDVSRAWDVWYYHLPFAARIWGIASAATSATRFMSSSPTRRAPRYGAR